MVTDYSGRIHLDLSAHSGFVNGLAKRLRHSENGIYSETDKSTLYFPFITNYLHPDLFGFIRRFPNTPETVYTDAKNTKVPENRTRKTDHKKTCK